MSSHSSITVRGKGTHQRNLTPSLLAGCIALALQPSATLAADTVQNQTLIVEESAQAPDTGEQDYSVKATTAGTRMNMTQRDIPQSVSIVSKQRMQDQKLQSLGDVMNNTTGISSTSADSDRSTFYSRGFQIDNYMVDGIPTFFEARWNLGDALSDTALFERVEVVRGANGLMTGTGNPSAAINMVRKHADSQRFKGDISAEYGSWNKQRYVIDLQSPLTENGRVRGRVVTGYQNNDSWLDRYNNEKKFFYSVLDADLGESSTLSVGYEYQEINTDSPTWSGLPRWYTDGSKADFNRSRSTSPDWAYNDKDFNKVFATLKHRFANNWELTFNGTHTEMNLDSKMMYISNGGYIDRATGYLTNPGGSLIGGTGYNVGKRKTDALDLTATGPYQLFGRQHQMMMGGSYSKQSNRYMGGTFGTIYSDELGNFFDYHGKFPETDWGDLKITQYDRTHMKSLYTATRISLADPLHLIVGARYTKWSIDTLTRNMEKNNTTPYAGLIWDIDDNWSAYASYTSVFQPQTSRDINGSYLSPITGNNYELGLKSDWMNSRLTTTLALFRIEQDNVAQSTGQQILVQPVRQLIKQMDGTVSKGVDFEINGALTDNWQMTFGATRYLADDKDGKPVKPTLPRTTIKLFTSYRPAALQALTLGGGVNWQNGVHDDLTTPYGTGVQSRAALPVDLFGRYEVTKNLSVQANVNNLLDKKYDTSLSGTMVYGAPRSVSVSASYRF